MKWLCNKLVRTCRGQRLLNQAWRAAYRSYYFLEDYRTVR